MARTEITCAYCGAKAKKENGAINRARATDSPLYCSLKCSGLARRLNKSKEQKKAEKREYDRQYRHINRELLKTKKAEYFRRTYDPEKARVDRKKRAAAHAEYCRRPEYRAWKKSYDRQYRAKKRYGEFWECFLLTLDIRDECLHQASDYEIRKANDTLTKVQRRKRDANIKRH
ncbi:MAG: hypothetical protein AB2793_06225 [Candidatus Thiodiazotropha sp.]